MTDHFPHDTGIAAEGADYMDVMNAPGQKGAVITSSEGRLSGRSMQCDRRIEILCSRGIKYNVDTVSVKGGYARPFGHKVVGAPGPCGATQILWRNQKPSRAADFLTGTTVGKLCRLGPQGPFDLRVLLCLASSGAPAWVGPLLENESG